MYVFFFFFSSRRRHTRFDCDWSSDVCSSDLAMVTIAFGLIVEGVLIEWGSVTGGPGGIFNIPKPALRSHYWTVMLAAALALWLTANLRRSAWGRAFLAVKSSEVAAESLGLAS